jgi:hypothetical protein
MADVYDNDAMGQPMVNTTDSCEPSDVAQSPGGPKKASIRDSKLRWFMLIFGCFFLMGSYFCFDIPASLGPAFKKAPYGYSSAKIATMYSVYSLPNTVLPLFGGVLIDKIGIK